MKLKKSNVQFKVNNRLIKFVVVHNLNKRFGMSFNDALDNWLARTNEFTATSLCEYIKSKDESFVAMTEKQYKRLFAIDK